MKSVLIPVLYLACSVLISGCGAKYYFEKAKNFEKKGFYAQAADGYKIIADKYPSSNYAPASLYFAGVLYQKKLKVYDEAIKSFSLVSSKYAQSQYWIKLSRIGIFDSPDYFPLEDSYSWTEGDSVSLGKNMRAEISCKLISNFMQPENEKDLVYPKGYIYCRTKRIFAGKALVAEIKKYYIKDDFELREMDNPQSGEYSVILQYPFEEKKTWTTVRDKQKMRYAIVGAAVTVQTGAGKFDNCVKVQEENLDYAGSYKYEYYAPEVGLVLVSVGSGEKETRNTELTSYSVK